MRALQWIWNMKLEIGLHLAYTVANVLVYLAAIALIVFVVNKLRDRDERRNVGVKERRIINKYRLRAAYWRRRCEDAERLAGSRLAIIRCAMVDVGSAQKSLTFASMQLRGSEEHEEELILREVAK